MRARQNRTDDVRRSTTAGPLAEPLERRSYLSMTLDLRVAGGAKTAAATAVGQVINLQAYAVISGTTAGSNDAFLDAVGSFLATKGGTGGVVGNLSATLITDFAGSGASNGTVQDLNGDAGLDVGSDSASDASGYFAARSGTVDYDGAVSGDTNAFLLATLTYTVTALGTGTATTLNFRPSGSADNSYSAVWYQDGSPFFSATADANFKIGTAVTITGPTAPTPTPTPTPTTTRLTGTTFGTAGSFANSGNTIAKATDGSLTTFFDAPTASGSYVGIDLGSAKAVTAIRFAPRSGWAARMVGGAFQASGSATFASGVVTVATIKATPTVGVLTSITPSTATAYRYWRYVGPTNSYCDIAEFQLFGTSTAPTLTQLTGTAIGTAGSYANGGNTIARAVDNSVTTFFDGPTANGDWVGLDLGSAKTVSTIKYAPRAGWTTRMLGGIFQASNSATFSTGVVNLATVTTTPVAGALTTVTLATPVTYRYYRYLAPAGSYGDIAEFELYA